MERASTIMATGIEKSQLLAQLVSLVGGGNLNENVELKYEGTQIVLPPNMTEDEAIQVLQRRRDENNTEVQVMEIIPGYPLDSLLALQRAMSKKYGWTDLRPMPGFWGPRPPRMVAITVDDQGTTVSVPWGKMVIPSIKGWLQPSVNFDSHGQPQLSLGGIVQRRSMAAVSELAAMARQEVLLGSIYKGKAIRVEFPKFDADHPFDPQVHVPQFLKLNGVSRSDLVFRADVDWAVQTSIFTPITKIEKLREMGTPFRSGVLASGEYGVGKTLLANVTAKLCEDHSITFIYLAQTSDIAQARSFARQYQPAVIFAEDVDSVLAGESRDERVNEVLNVIDGVEGKSDEVMVIFSTNHPEKINRALLRPGRMDAVITIEPPDAEAVARLIKLYAKETLAKSVDLREVSEMLAGNIPAAIREVVERAKKAALYRSANGSLVSISSQDLIFSAKSMTRHLAMLKEKPCEPLSDEEKAAKIQGEALGKALRELKTDITARA
jgi:transitional endoplasmic reticulum ATPase